MHTCTENELHLILERTRRQADRLAQRGLPQGMDADDLFSAGQEGVVRSLKSYTKAHGANIYAYTATASKRAMFKLIDSERKRKTRERPLATVTPDGEEVILFPDNKASEPGQLVSAKEELQQVKQQPRLSKRGGCLTLTEIIASLPSAIETARKIETLRQTIYNAIKEEDVTNILGTMINEAKKGNVAAAKLVLGQLSGKSAPVRIRHTIVAGEQDLSDFG